MQQKWLRVVFRRRIFVIALLLFQIFLIIFLAVGTSKVSVYMGLALNGISIGVCLYVLNKKEKPAYKLTWIFLILLFPIFGGLVYVIFHTQTNPRKFMKRSKKIISFYKPLFLLPGNTLPAMKERHKDSAPQAHYLQEHAGFPAYTHTRTVYFSSGEAFFKQVLVELDKAENQYTIKTGAALGLLKFISCETFGERD